MTFQRADDVAADLPPGKLRDLRPRRRLQVSDRRHGQELGRRQLREARVAQAPGVRRSDGVGEARLGAQLIAAGDEDEIVGPGAQFVGEVGEEIVEIAARPTNGAKASRGTGSVAAKIAASTRNIHSRQRAPCGKSASSASKASIVASLGPWRSQPIKPKTRSPRHFAHGAQVDQTVEQSTRGAIRKTGAFRGARRRDAILSEQQLDDARRALGSQFRRNSEKLFSTSREFDGQGVRVAGGERIGGGRRLGQPESFGRGRAPAAPRRSEGARIFVMSKGTGLSQPRRRASRRSAAHAEKTSPSGPGEKR